MAKEGNSNNTKITMEVFESIENLLPVYLLLRNSAYYEIISSLLIRKSGSFTCAVHHAWQGTYLFYNRL